jgi:hypothetical protein
MPKKQKRSYSRGEGSATVAPVRETVASQPVAPKMAPSQVRTGTYAEFNPDYSYVVRDLKKIAIMAGSFIVVLVALSFILK